MTLVSRYNSKVGQVLLILKSHGWMVINEILVDKPTSHCCVIQLPYGQALVEMVLFILHQHTWQNSFWILKVEFLIVFYISVTFFHFIKNTFSGIKQNNCEGKWNSSEGTGLTVLGDDMPRVNATQKQWSAIVSLSNAYADQTVTNQMYILLSPLTHLFTTDFFTIQSKTKK